MSEERDDGGKWVSGFITGLIVGLLLALGGAGGYFMWQMQRYRMEAVMEAERARAAEMMAREEADRAREMLEEAAFRAREAEKARKEAEKPGHPPATKPGEKAKP
jgi:hypothetical protein